MNITAKEKKQIQNDLENELIRIYANKASPEILDEYDFMKLFRLTAFLTFIITVKT